MSGAGEDAARTLASSRAALGDAFAAAQSHLKVALIVFVITLFATIYVLWLFVWDRLKADLLGRAPEATVVAVTPFDVILLQVKIGIIVGALVALPLLAYLSRDSLRARGLWADDRIPRYQIGLIAGASVLLFTGGVLYGYLVFFPLAFDFLANNAAQSGFQPTYSIVKWAQFILLLSISFGLAAQLPLAMSALAYTEIVPYETWRTYWKHAIVGLYAIGAIFTPPDPLTQIMWATPLVGLYAVSLWFTRFVVGVKRGSERVGVRTVARNRWQVLLGSGVLAGALTYASLVSLATGRLDGVLASLPTWLRPAVGPTILGQPAPIGGAILGVVVGGGVAVVVLLYAVTTALEAAPPDRPAPASAGDPVAIDVGALDAAGVRAAPDEAFAAMTEPAALELASDAMDAGEHEKAQAILDRFDAAPSEPIPDEPAADESGNAVTETGANMLDAFTAEETTEEEVGGYIYDVAFILDSVTTKAIWIVGAFMVVLAAVFMFLYTGGIRTIKDTFLSRLPPGVTAEQVNVVTLHPVEALIFEIKIATVLAAVATLPIFLYFAWPALKERGLARGNRNVLLVWGLAILGGLVVGAAIGFGVIAPAVISYLAYDAIRANMIIAYRINNFGWLVFLTTVGVGLLADIPVTMVMFHRGGLVPYRTMRRRWREVTVSVFIVVALVSPRGVFMMFLIGIPVMLAYLLGLGILWVYTLGGRRHSPLRRTQRAD